MKINFINKKELIDRLLDLYNSGDLSTELKELLISLTKSTK